MPILLTIKGEITQELGLLHWDQLKHISKFIMEIADNRDYFT